PTFTSRAGFAVTPFDSMRPRSQARDESARVLKKRAAHSHLSILTPVTIPFSYSEFAPRTDPMGLSIDTPTGHDTSSSFAMNHESIRFHPSWVRIFAICGTCRETS